MDEPDALLELRLLVLLGRLERALEVVEHGQELLHEPLAGPRDQALLVARGPLAVVVEVGLEALERVEISSSFSLRSASSSVDLRLLEPRSVFSTSSGITSVFASSSSMTS